MALKTIDIGGKERPVSVGLAMANYYCKDRGWTIKQFTDAFSEKRLQSMDFAIDEIMDFVYYALFTGAKATKAEVDFTKEDVIFWVDEKGMGAATEVMAAMGDDHIPKDEAKDKAKKKKAST